MVALGLGFPLGWEGRRRFTSANYGYWSTPVLFPPAVGTWKSGSTQEFLPEAEIRIYSTLPWLRNTSSLVAWGKPALSIFHFGCILRTYLWGSIANRSWG